MSLVWFLSFAHSDPAVALSPQDAERLAGTLKACPGLDRARVHTPAQASDPYSDDGPGPVLVLELEFGGLAACERALETAGPLSALAEPRTLPSLQGAKAAQQGFLARQYDVPEPRLAATVLCTYLVQYPGPAADVRAWHYHYARHHPAIMATFPRVREVAIYTPAEIISGLPFARACAMQRNKVAFDNPADLDAALHSPVRETMRDDFLAFPSFEGGNAHHPMHTRVVG